MNLPALCAYVVKCFPSPNLLRGGVSHWPPYFCLERATSRGIMLGVSARHAARPPRASSSRLRAVCGVASSAGPLSSTTALCSQRGLSCSSAHARPAPSSVWRSSTQSRLKGPSPSARTLHTTSRCDALSKFTMPAMSPTMTEGGIASWKKKEGESFAPGDVLLEIETDKATMDVEAQDEGVVAKIVVGDGSKAVQVGKVIAVMAEDADDIEQDKVDKLASEAESEEPKKEEPKQESKEDEAPKKEEAPAEQKEKPKDDAEPDTKSSKKQDKSTETKQKEPSVPRSSIYATPAAKRLALDKGVPLSKVKGTGPNSIIVVSDVEGYKSDGPVASSGPSPAVPTQQIGAKADAGALPAYTDTPVSGMRRTIANRLTESKRDTPHYYLTAEINADRLLKLREVFNKASQSASEKSPSDGVKAGTKLSVNDFVLKAASIALQDVPEANAGWHGDFVRQYHKADISMAVATPTGLITPIVKDVGSKGLASISAEAKALAARARDGKLQSHEYQGGSFTVSNLGMLGISHFTAIINPPQSCILAIGATEQKLVLDPSSEKGFKAINVIKVTLSCDHRVVDGAVGARWMKAFSTALENPLTFML
ncbi:uncharacterized protein L969DRAFT_68485 [Mixia osmundae IAM 14324]|uniref:Acetyltransferase component of pyruvate dehydrogenase complex n=1 Tax=Mixia osmundae (strain CBS 9802 / IAM 14324 / JCM 22182 / KY 12970) TaxID=764103 RepID=G7E782_MIXOS|nr:uncharacterized protein L969DRAFT_68485 [Mixia osmundae IAM 14324]KEI41915.1 hypothetical protein L969DRAFT_68485 [Mixia osmundae IAM 14324]GAA98692.1 hypothetical protein E5Q_05380 [Mixia osmundae IAM 14324]